MAIASALLALLQSPASSGAELAYYRVTLGADLSMAQVEVEPASGVAVLLAGSGASVRHLDQDVLHGAALVEGELVLAHVGGIVRYGTNIRPEPTRLGSLGALTDMPLTLSDPRLWLWLPAGFAGDDTVRVEFVLPPKVGVASPWRARREGRDAVSYELRPSMLDAEGLVAFGTLAQRELIEGGTTLRLSVASTNPAEVARFNGWAEGVWRSTRQAVAGPPGSLEQLLVVPVRNAREAVPWGEVRRGTGNSVLALVQRAPVAAEFREDWTLYHELSHLYLPYLGGDRWLSEGFASYYQNVLRARAGVIAPEVAWQQLAAGLARGAKAAKADQTVERGGRMVTYWTAAALALEWDLALRQASGGKASLDSVLARFAASSLPAREAWDAMRVAAVLDKYAPEALGKDYFSRTMAHTLAQRGFPKYLGSFVLAGIDPVTGRARPDAPPELVALMRPQPAAGSPARH